MLGRNTPTCRIYRAYCLILLFMLCSDALQPNKESKCYKRSAHFRLSRSVCDVVFHEKLPVSPLLDEGKLLQSTKQ